MIFVYVLIFCAGFCCGWTGLALAINRIEREEVFYASKENF